MAEVYSIYNFYELTPEYVAILAVGLDDNSRTKRKLTGQKIKSDTYLLATLCDDLNMLLYGIADPKKRGNPPKSILDRLLGNDDQETSNVFETPDDFRSAWREIVGGKNG